MPTGSSDDAPLAPVPKYAPLIIALVTGTLLASGAVGLYFSYRDNQAQLIALQDEKAQGAAVRIEQYVQDIEHQLSWTALPQVADAARSDRGLVADARNLKGEPVLAASDSNASAA